MTDADEFLSDFSRFLAAQGDRGLGNVGLASRVATFQFERGLDQAAENLLIKAMKALVDDDQAKATRLIRRSLDLPLEEHGNVPRAVGSAHQLLFASVTDALEDSFDATEDEWLEACMVVAARALHDRLVLDCDRTVSDPDARVIGLQFGAVLSAIESEYDLPPSWRKRINTARAWLPEPSEDVFDLNPDTDPEHWVTATLLAVASFELAYADMI